MYISLLAIVNSVYFLHSLPSLDTFFPLCSLFFLHRITEHNSKRVRMVKSEVGERREEEKHM